MTTNPERPNATKELNSYHFPPTNETGNAQSVAIRGATQAFSAKGDTQQAKALPNSTNSARAAAGYVANQKSLSLLNRPASAFGANPQPLSAHASQVRQLVKGFEQSSTNESPQLRRNNVIATGGVPSRSPSQVAARLASTKSSLPCRPSLPPRNVLKDNSSPVDTGVSSSYRGVSAYVPGSQLRSSENVHRLSHEALVSTPRPLGPASSTQTMPAALTLEQNPSAREQLRITNLQHDLPQRESSMLAAQAAVRHNVPVHASSVPQSPRRERKDPFDFNDGLSEELDRGRRPLSRSKPLGSEMPVSADILDQRLSQKLSPKLKTLDLSAETPEKVSTLSKPVGHLRTPSKQAESLASSVSNAQYTDERTGLTELSLADAIVASSLASSRAPSPAKHAAPAPPPPRKSSVTRSLFRHRQTSDTDLSRHSSPHKGMRQTLRKHSPEDSSDEDSRRKHKHFMKHPNKHREGSRKRWKDKVTERERKRYEGVWAANKGIFVPSQLLISDISVTLETSASDMILDLVVRDIWNRSRLPTDILAEIWDLVDRQGVGVLARDEFVLGLWLIDQKLKGRKLPIRVSPTLWASVRYARGAKVPRRL